MTTHQDQPLSRRAIREREAAARAAGVSSEAAAHDVEQSAGQHPTTASPVTPEPLSYVTQSRAPLPQYDSPLPVHGQDAAHVSQPPAPDSGADAGADASQGGPSSETPGFRYREYAPDGRRAARTSWPPTHPEGADLDYRTQGRVDLPTASDAVAPPTGGVPVAGSPEGTLSRRELRALREAAEREQAGQAQSGREQAEPGGSADGRASAVPVWSPDASTPPAFSPPVSRPPIAESPVAESPVSPPPAASAPPTASVPPVASAPPAPPPLVEPEEPRTDALADFEALFRGEATSSVAPAPPASPSAGSPSAPPVGQHDAATSAAPAPAEAAFGVGSPFAAPAATSYPAPATAEPPSGLSGESESQANEGSATHTGSVPAAPAPRAYGADPVAPDAIAPPPFPVTPEAAPAAPAPATSVPAASAPPSFAQYAAGFEPPSPLGAASVPAPDASLPLPPVTEPAGATGASVPPTTGERPLNHWSRQAELDDESQPPTASVGRGIAVSSATANALVLPENPHPDMIMSPVRSTGDVLVTGSISLPASLASTGAMPTQFDESALDNLLDPGDLQVASTDSQPVRAIRAVSTHTSSREIIGASKPQRGNRALTALIISAAGMAVVVVTLLVVALTSGVLG